MHQTKSIRYNFEMPDLSSSRQQTQCSFSSYLARGRPGKRQWKLWLYPPFYQRERVSSGLTEVRASCGRETFRSVLQEPHNWRPPRLTIEPRGANRAHPYPWPALATAGVPMWKSKVALTPAGAKFATGLRLAVRLNLYLAKVLIDAPNSVQFTINLRIRDRAACHGGRR